MCVSMADSMYICRPAGLSLVIFVSVVAGLQRPGDGTEMATALQGQEDCAKHKHSLKQLMLTLDSCTGPPSESLPDCLRLLERLCLCLLLCFLCLSMRPSLLFVAFLLDFSRLRLL